MGEVHFPLLILSKESMDFLSAIVIVGIGNAEVAEEPVLTSLDPEFRVAEN